MLHSIEKNFSLHKVQITVCICSYAACGLPVAFFQNLLLLSHSLWLCELRLSSVKVLLVNILHSSLETKVLSLLESSRKDQGTLFCWTQHMYSRAHMVHISEPGFSFPNIWDTVQEKTRVEMVACKISRRAKTPPSIYDLFSDAYS